MRSILVSFVVLLLTACTGWPGPGDYKAMPASRELIEGFDHASPNPLGTAADAREIKKAILDTDTDMTVTEVRWLSPIEVIVDANDLKPGVGGGLYYYIDIHKGGSGWQCDIPCWYRSAD